MKIMKLWIAMLLAVVLMPLLNSCGGDDEATIETPTVDISLSRQSVEMTYGGSEIVYCNNVNVAECDIKIEDDYVVSVSISKNAINIISKHVGKTKISITKNGLSGMIDVTVHPTVNIIDIPYIAYGVTKDDIKSRYSSSEIYKEDKYTLVIHKSSPLLYHYYYFKNGLCNSIETYAQSSYDYSEFAELMKEYASENDTFWYTLNGSNTKETGYIYKRDRDYYIVIRRYQGDFNGFYVTYPIEKPVFR